MLSHFYRGVFGLVFLSLVLMVGLAGWMGCTLLGTANSNLVAEQLFGLCALFCLALGGGVFLIALQLAGARAVGAEPAQTRRRGWPVFILGAALLLGVLGGAWQWRDAGAKPPLAEAEKAQKLALERRRFQGDALYHKDLLMGLLPVRMDGAFLQKASMAARLIEKSSLAYGVGLLFPCTVLGQEQLCRVGAGRWSSEDLRTGIARNSEKRRRLAAEEAAHQLLDDEQRLEFVAALDPAERLRVDSLLRGLLPGDTLLFARNDDARNDENRTGFYVRIARDSLALLLYMQGN